jgi:penicillin-binding protein 1B
VQTRSMVYTDYFLRGKQPIDVCPLHEGHGFFDRVAGMFGKDTEEPVPAEAAGLPPTDEAARPTTGVVTGGTLPDAQKTETPEEPRKKRGFWSRVFGGGKDKDKDKDKERDKEQEHQRP